MKILTNFNYPLPDFNATLTKSYPPNELFLTRETDAPENAQILTHFHAMKKAHKVLFWAFVGWFAFAIHPAEIQAQDDLYYDPATDAPATTSASYSDEYNEGNNVTRRYDDDDPYYEDDDYAYEYSSRIRRFHRRSYVADYYDPFFVDLYNYDPFFAPGASIYVYNYNDYWMWRRWNRWNRWNSWNNWGWGWNSWGWNSWGWNSCYSFNSPWYNPWVVNNFYYDPYWTWNGYNPYFNDVWVNNHYFYNNNGNGGGGGFAPQTYTGPRRSGTQVNPGYARIPDGKGRLATAQDNVKVLERSSTRPGRTAGDIDNAEATGRTKSPDAREATPTSGVRRPDNTRAEPTTGRPRNPEAAPAGRDAEKSTRRPEDVKSRPSRNETPARRGNEGYTPRRTESSPSRNEESRPSRRSEERSYERPSRNSENNNGGYRESRPSRSNDSGSMRSSGGDRGSSGSSGNSSRSSGGSSGGRSSSGRGGRN